MKVLKRKVLKRAIESLICGGIVFLILSFLYKFILSAEEKWLLTSILWSSGWTIGYFLAKLFSELKMRRTQTFLFNLLLTVIFTLFLIFILGIVIDIVEWEFIVYELAFSFAVGLFANSDWKNE